MRFQENTFISHPSCTWTKRNIPMPDYIYPLTSLRHSTVRRRRCSSEGYLSDGHTASFLSRWVALSLPLYLCLRLPVCLPSLYVCLFPSLSVLPSSRIFASVCPTLSDSVFSPLCLCFPCLVSSRLIASRFLWVRFLNCLSGLRLPCCLTPVIRQFLALFISRRLSVLVPSSFFTLSVVFFCFVSPACLSIYRICLALLYISIRLL